MKYFKILLPLFVIIIVVSCSNSSKNKILGKWKVEETGIQGLEITYEFRESKIIIESRLNRNPSDSLEEAPIKNAEENYIIQTDSASFMILEITDMENNAKGEYRINIEENEMTIVDLQGENIRLKKI